jgi:hypothetical protein
MNEKKGNYMSYAKLGYKGKQYKAVDAILKLSTTERLEAIQLLLLNSADDLDAFSSAVLYKMNDDLIDLKTEHLRIGV